MVGPAHSSGPCQWHKEPRAAQMCLQLGLFPPAPPYTMQKRPPPPPALPPWVARNPIPFPALTLFSAPPAPPPLPPLPPAQTPPPLVSWQLPVLAETAPGTAARTTNAATTVASKIRRFIWTFLPWFRPAASVVPRGRKNLVSVWCD